MSDHAQRPQLGADLTGAELRRWYWLRSELEGLARELGVRTGGGKAVLTERLAAALDGHDFAEPAAVRRSTAAQLVPPLDHGTVIPAGQRCSQVLRAWFTEQVGPGFRFDAHLRDFIGAADGTTTLGDALDHWTATRDVDPGPIGAQFELNRFTREWWAAHPDGSPEQLRAAWWEHRSRPRDARH